MARILIDLKDREGVAAPLPLKIYQQFASGEKPIPEEGTLDRLSFDVAKIYAEKRDATDAEKTMAVSGLKELSKQFSNMGFVGFGCALYSAMNPEVITKHLWHINAIHTAMRIITEPPRPDAPTSAPVPGHQPK